MKILFYMDSLHSGGKERRLVELIQGLSKFSNYEMQLVLSKKEIHYKQIYATSVKIHYIERKGFKKDPRNVYKFYKIVKYFHPDVIHVWNYTEAMIAIPTKLILNIPLINSQIASSPIEVSPSIFRHKLTFTHSDKILANSFAGLDAYKGVLSKKNLKKCSVIYNGFNFERIRNLRDENKIREQFKIKTEFIVGMVASFSYKKDYTTFIKAANFVLKNKKDITFLCIGSGDPKKHKNMVEIQNKEKILFLGKQNDVESIMNICDIGVLSTFTEGISNSLLEFMALGKPVVVTGEGGCKELVSNKRNGYVLGIGNFEELAKKIIFLLNNLEVFTGFSGNSKRIVEEKFSISTMVDEFKTIYENYK